MKSLVSKMLKPAVNFVLVVLLVSCIKMGSNEYYVRFTGAVEISNAIIPDTVTNMSVAHIIASAKGYNGCWRDLGFLLTKNSDFEYSLQAFGLYESNGTCPSVVVHEDTSIAFQPKDTGLYKFYVMKGENQTEIDTMIVR
jgi:hypothetical protein